MGEKQKVFITAKTYPTKSSSYQELVCTAGITEDGEWVRLYPIPFRKLYKDSQFNKYTWIEAELGSSFNDHRPDSRKINISSLEILEHVDTDNNWAKRRQIILNNTPVYTNIKTIISKAQKENSMSLCTFKPTEFLEVEIIEKTNIKIYTHEEKIKFKNSNHSLFDEEDSADEFIMMPEIPYKFKLPFIDDSGKKSSMSIIDWEISQLYLNLKKKEKNENIVIQKVKDKIESFIANNDLHLFLGTMRTMHSRSKNPYTIIGLFYPPKDTKYQGSLFD